jgi:uncharacterized protein YjiS (DUF1127 family)
MNAFHFGIASIIDSNTGSGLPRAPSATGIGIARRKPARSRVKVFIDYLQRVRDGIGVARTVLRKRRELNKSLRQLNRLDDRMLDDIGLTRGDLIAAGNGQMDLEQLEHKRILNRGSSRVVLRNIPSEGRLPANAGALNEAVFARAKCA